MIATPSLASPAQDSETLKALEIANIRLKAANDQIEMLNDRLAAKDTQIQAKDEIIKLKDMQIGLMKENRTDSDRIVTIDQFRIEACQQQLSRADAEIARLKSPGLLRSIFDTRTLTGAVIGFGLGRVK